MKRNLKIWAISIASFLAILYLSFLLIIPNVINLNEYKSLVQSIAKEQTSLDVDFTNAKITTTPLLHAGVIIEGLNVKLPDKSDLISTEKIKIRLSLPHLLLLTVKIPTAEISSPTINLDIQNGEQYKVIKLVEDIVNAQKEDFSKIKTTNEKSSFNTSLIKIIVPAFTLKNYKILINDIKNNQNMELSGEKISIGYFNGKKAKVNANTQVLIDGAQKVSSNIFINTFIPKFPPALDEEDDDTQRLEIPFVNPIDIYKTYDFKANIDANIKVREAQHGIIIKGYSNIEDISMTLSGYQLPQSFIKLIFAGKQVFIDTDLYVNPNARLSTTGKIGYGKRPFADLNFISSKIYYNDLIVFTKALLDTFCIPNNLVDIKGEGYFVTDAKIKTNFKKWKSSGSILIKNGGLTSPKVGLLIKDANADINLDNNIFKIENAKVNINGSELIAHGQIDNKAVSDLYLHTDNLSLKELYAVFAPNIIKQQYALKSGILSLHAQLQGKLKKAQALVNIDLKNFVMNEKANTFIFSNEDLNIKLDTKHPSIDCSIVNKNMKLSLPTTKSSILFPLIALSIDENNINILRSGFRINKSSVINFQGNILNYLSNPQIDIFSDGKIYADDLKTLAGNNITYFIDGKGFMPLYLSLKGTMNKMTLLTQLMTDANNYFSPITFEEIKDKQNIFQAKIDYKGNRIKIKETGLYTKTSTDSFTPNLEANLENSKQIALIEATITSLNSTPYINLFKIIIPKQMNGSIYALKDSKFILDKTMLFAYGSAIQPKIRGIFKIIELSIPNLFINIKEAYTDMREREMFFAVKDLLINGSDLNINGHISLDDLPLLVIPTIKIESNNIDVSKLNDVAIAASKITPKATTTTTSSTNSNTNTQSTDIPIWLQNGTINFKRIDASPIIALNTNGKISIKDNIFKLDNLKTTSIGGSITGNVSMNLLNSLLTIKVNGKDFNVEKALYTLANMKDTLAGNANFKTNISLNAAAPNQIEQMKSLYGTVDFNIVDGQLGPFGRIENLILAENIRESKFFQTTLGSIVNSFITIESSHFQNLDGHLEFADGIVSINPIKTVGKVLCVHIAGNMNLVTNIADMKLRAKLGSQFSNMLGPLAALNPINLVKATPGLNVMAAQAFRIFCESVTQEEMNALPNFVEEFSDLSTTKFQVVIAGDVAKPLTLIKSFKWLALDEEINAAQNFVNTLPDPSIMPNAESATYEEIMQMKAQIEALHAKEDAKLINRAKRLLNIEYKYSNEI